MYSLSIRMLNWVVGKPAAELTLTVVALGEDVPRILVAAASGPRCGRVKAVAADVRLDAGAHARARADGGVVRDVDVAADDDRRLVELDVRVEAEVAGDVHARGAVDVVLQLLVAGAAGVAR